MGIQVDVAYKSLNKFNIMVLGKTGVGKSTLINNLFLLFKYLVNYIPFIYIISNYI